MGRENSLRCQMRATTGVGWVRGLEDRIPPPHLDMAVQWYCISRAAVLERDPVRAVIALAVQLVSREILYVVLLHWPWSWSREDPTRATVGFACGV